MRLLDERICSLFQSRWQQTVTYWSVFFSFGLYIAFLGPTVLDLKCQTHSTFEEITWVFFSQQLFLLAGSCLGGLWKKTLRFSLSALFSCTLIISLVFAFIPLCHHVVLLAIAIATAGTAMGMIDTIANMQLVKLYHEDSAIFLQALHFFIGLGALVSPLVVEPFLADDSCVVASNWTGNSSNLSSLEPQHLHSSVSSHGAAPHNVSLYPLQTVEDSFTTVSYAFWIMSLINLPVPAAVLALMYYERLLPCCHSSPPLLNKDSGPNGVSSQAHSSVFSCCNLDKLRGRRPTFFLLHALGGVILFITDGVIGSYAGFVYSYAVSPPLLMAHKTAGYLDSTFWASITAGRLAFIYLSCRYTAPRLLTLCLVGVVLVQCMLLILYTSCVFLFIGTCVLGLCISSVFPSILAFTEDALDYKGCGTTVLVTSASAGEMLMQLLIGSVIHSQGSYAFVLTCTVASLLAMCFFLLLLYVQHIHKNTNRDVSEDTEMKEKPKPGAS
ncbi:major facilitator superfamily domain-containing protein 4A [Aulostomus maculatus]